MPRPLLAAAVLLLGLCQGSQVLAQVAGDVSYQVRYARAGDTIVSVELTWAPALAAARALVMPRAIPMGYGEQRYDAFVRDVTAFAGTTAGRAAPREEGPRWRLEAGTSRVIALAPTNGAKNGITEHARPTKNTAAPLRLRSFTASA